MSSVRPRSRRHAGILAAAMLLLPGAAHARGDDPYEQGVAALGGGRWLAARQAFERAIADKPKSSKRHGGYFPYYMLGVAWQGEGSCRRALDSWAEEERQGEIQGSSAAANMRTRQQGCQQLLTQLDQLATRIGQDAAALGPQLTDLLQRAAASSSTAGRAAPQQAGISGDAVRGELAGMAAAARAAADEEGRQKLQDLDNRLAALRRQIAATAERIRSADAAEAAARAAAARRAAEQRAREAQAARERQVAHPSPALVTAVTAFVHGDAAATLAALSSLEPATPLEAAHSCLLRGAALFDQATAAAHGGPPELAEARQALAGCGWREQGLTLAPRVFSPRFAVFAQSVGP